MPDSLPLVPPASPAPAACDECTRRDVLRDSIHATVALLGLSTLSPVRALLALAPRASGAPVRYPIPTGDGVSVDKTHQVMLARAGAEVYAFALACPHQNTALKALPGSAGFQCPRHKSRYRADGTFISGRATRNMDRLPISRDGDSLVVDPDVAYESDKDAARWASAVVKL